MSKELSEWAVVFDTWLRETNAGKYGPLEMSMELYQASCALLESEELQDAGTDGKRNVDGPQAIQGEV